MLNHEEVIIEKSANSEEKSELPELESSLTEHTEDHSNNDSRDAESRDLNGERKMETREKLELYSRAPNDPIADLTVTLTPSKPAHEHKQ